MKRYLMKFSYDGTNFHGYQVQPGLRTVQGEIERVLTFINQKKDTIIQSSGRTDANVHALGQTASFDLDVTITLYKLKCALNSNLPEDIHVISVEEVDSNFHARFNAKKKEYIYLLNMGEYNPVDRNYIYQYNKKLDINKMNEAIQYFIGEHDFRSFVSAEDKRENSIRKIYKAKIEIKEDIIKFTFVANGFLKYQVRNMVGSLIWVGESRLKPIDIKSIIEYKDRRKAGITAPACGLYLKEVKY